MKLSGFFSSTTATCTATALVALACCPLVMSIQAHREAHRISAAKHALLPVPQPWSAGAHKSPWMSVSLRSSPLPLSTELNAPVVQSQTSPTTVARAPQHERSPAVEQPTSSNTSEASLAELQPPSTFLVSIDSAPTPTTQTPVNDTLDEIAFLPPQSVLTHRQHPTQPTHPVAKTTEEPIEELPKDPLALIPAFEPSNWQTANEPLAVVAQRAEQEIKRAVSLADKGAVFSARKQLETVLQTIAHGLDVHYGIQAHSDCLAYGLLALHEASDFLPVSGNARSRTSVSTIAAKHQSQILTKSEREELEPADAMRRYYAYANEHLKAATGGSPVASQALHGLGKLEMSQANQDLAAQRAHNLNALALFQVAVQAYESNYLAANELGVLLAREGRLEDARSALQKSVAVQPMAEAWHNLTVVHERLGEHERSAQARMEWQRIAQSSNQSGIVTAANGSAVHWVDKATFERGIVPNAPVFGAYPGGGALR
jgi:tetratricopeptide (TPR) repeat protein